MLDGTETGTKIEKAVHALLKIHQLIEVGYGGNTCPTDKSFFTIIYDWIDKEFYVRKEDNLLASNLILIGFHTKEQAEEFISYPENIQLLKNYLNVSDIKKILKSKVKLSNVT